MQTKSFHQTQWKKKKENGKQFLAYLIFLSKYCLTWRYNMTIEDELEQFKYKIQDLEDDMRQLKNEKETLKEEINDLLYDINSLECDVADIQSDVASLEEDVVNPENEVNDE